MFNFLKKLSEKLFGMKRGDEDYHKVVDAGKVAAPILLPLAQDYLTSHGIPTTPEGAALALLNAKETGRVLGSELDGALKALAGMQG